MKKLLLFTLAILCTASCVFAASDTDVVKSYFNKYVNAANTYNSKLFDYYDPNAKIIRQVVKPDNTTANVTTNMSVYKRQMNISQGVAKMRGYKNRYSNISVSKLSNGNVKVTALRQPMNDKDRLKTYQIWHKKSNGTWVIVEEMMQTRQQIFLRYADKK